MAARPAGRGGARAAASAAAAASTAGVLGRKSTTYQQEIVGNERGTYIGSIESSKQ